MAASIPQVTTQSLGIAWLNQTNAMAAVISANAVTVANTVSGSTTVGNAIIDGMFRATTLIAGDQLRGGNTSVSAPLSITSGATVSNTFTVTGNTLLQSLSVTALTVTVNADINVLRVSGNTFVQRINATEIVANGSVTTPVLNISSTINVSGQLTAGALLINGTSTFQNTATFQSIVINGPLAVNNTISGLNLNIGAVANTQSLIVRGTATIAQGNITNLNSLALITANNIAGANAVFSKLQVNGDATVTGRLTFNSNTAISGTLTSDNVTIPGRLQVGTNGSFIANTSGVYVISLNASNVNLGNTGITGTLGVTANGAFNSNLWVAQNFNVGGAVGISGNLNINGDAGFARSLYVAGAIATPANINGANVLAENGTIRGAYVHSKGDLFAQGNGSVSGNWTAGGSVNGRYLFSSEDGQINRNFTVNGGINCGSIGAGFVNSTGNMQAAGSIFSDRIVVRGDQIFGFNGDVLRIVQFAGAGPGVAPWDLSLSQFDNFYRFRSPQLGTIFQLTPQGNLSIPGAFSQNSDRRVKEVLDEITVDTALDFVYNVPSMKYRYVHDPVATVRYGFIAQDIVARGTLGALMGDNVISDRPDVDLKGDDLSPDGEILTVNNDLGPVALLKVALKHALDKIDTLSARVAELEAK